jgi:hypothetical protein
MVAPFMRTAAARPGPSTPCAASHRRPHLGGRCLRSASWFAVSGRCRKISYASENGCSRISLAFPGLVGQHDDWGPVRPALSPQRPVVHRERIIDAQLVDRLFPGFAATPATREVQEREATVRQPPLRSEWTPECQVVVPDVVVGIWESPVGQAHEIMFVVAAYCRHQRSARRSCHDANGAARWRRAGMGSRLNRMDWGSVESSYELSLGALPQD